MANAHHKDGICLACGGMVDADGYAMGGEVDGDAGLPADQNGDKYMRPGPVSDNSPQRDDAERMRNFALAMKGKR